MNRDRKALLQNSVVEDMGWTNHNQNESKSIVNGGLISILQLAKVSKSSKWFDIRRTKIFIILILHADRDIIYTINFVILSCPLVYISIYIRKSHMKP